LKISGQSGKLLDSVNVLDSLEMFRTVWKTSGQSGIFPNSLEDFQTACKISGRSGEFSDSLEDFWTEWKVSRQYGRFQGRLEDFRTVWYFSGPFRQFRDSLEDAPDSLENCCTVYVAVSSAVSKENYLFILNKSQYFCL